MTRQFPDVVRYNGRDYDITAVDGVGLFDPLVNGLAPRMLGTACWRGFVCTYAVEGDQLHLADLAIGLDGTVAPDLFGVAGRAGTEDDHHSSATHYLGMAAPIEFTGRTLIGADEEDFYLHMGFWPAHLFRTVLELVFEGGRLERARPFGRDGRSTPAPGGTSARSRYRARRRRDGRRLRHRCVLPELPVLVAARGLISGRLSREDLLGRGRGHRAAEPGLEQIQICAGKNPVADGVGTAIPRLQHGQHGPHRGPRREPHRSPDS